MNNCGWVKNDSALNLDRYIHGKPIPSRLFCQLVEIFKLTAFMYEVIMCTPYSFCRDLIEIILEKIKILDGEAQLVVTENLILALFKSIKRLPPTSNLDDPLISNFNEAMLVFNKDYLPKGLRRSDFEEEEKTVTRYNGFRVKTIFKIFVELIKYNTSSDSYRQYPMYKFKTIRSLPVTNENPMFKKFFDVIMYKSMNMCDFSIHTWLSWYEVFDHGEDTNLQSAIGHLCFELCSMIENEVINEQFLMEFHPVLRNISIEKIDFANVDITDIDGMVKHVQQASKFHINEWIKKMIENPSVFSHAGAITVLDSSMDTIDFNCYKNIIDQSMKYLKDGNEWEESFCYALYNGLIQMDSEDKLNILKHIVLKYPEPSFFKIANYDSIISEIAHNEYKDNADRNVRILK